jgi:hypothetical protein
MNINCLANPCPILLSSSCVFYEGPNLVCTGINNNETLESVIQKLDTALCKISTGSGILNLTAISPITSSGGTTPVISTLMASNKLIGRSTSGDGVMEEISLGQGLVFNGTTLDVTVSEVFQNDIVVSLSGGKTLGKYTNGQTIPSAGLTFEAVMNDIAIEYLTPLFTSFKINGLDPYSVESGTIISGSTPFTFSILYSQNVNLNSLSIFYESTTLATGLAVVSPATVNISPAINLVGNGTTYNFKGTAVNTNSVTFTSANSTVTSRYKQFFGNVATTFPTNSAEVRALAGNNFANVNLWVTPVVSTTKFSFSIPDTKTLTEVKTSNLDIITSSFILSTFTVNDAGGNPIGYRTYNYSSDLPLNLTLTITVS